MEDADSDSDIDSDSSRHHAGRDIVHGLRTNSHAVGPRRITHKKEPFLLCTKNGSFCVLRHMGSLPLAVLAYAIVQRGFLDDALVGDIKDSMTPWEKRLFDGRRFARRFFV